ncbi:hypothetical protein HMPREF1317_1970 [Schaalia georgiae F0490]|uniref:WXG100 family type VII secretion target n=1 Tax=Schaalia georgiae F0490 TaxID=1125717 RepID=J0NL82_9ACTO|nr:hypothetical protein [Schaalia georgiae]EJF47919.1 hypothetical protein HMPREF1317_1970 [Schaalia georgiae F0490]
MADSGGVGTSLEVSVTSIDTRIPCNPDSVRDVAAWFYEAYSKVGDAVVEMSGNLLRNPEYWMGETANVYEEMLNKLRKSADDLSDRHYRAYEVLRAYAQQLDYHYRDMETIRNQAETAGLKIENDYDIMCPPPLPPKPQEPPQGTPIEDWWAWEDACREWDAAANNHDYYRTLVIRVERVWSDLEDWANKHLRPLQVESFTLLFANYFDQEAQGVADRPWQLAVDALDQGFARRAQVLEQQMNNAAAEVGRQGKGASHMVRPVMDEAVKNALEARADFRAGRSQAQGVGTAVAGIGYATLAYDIATSDTPGQTALAQGAGMAAGAAVGSAVGSTVTEAATSTALSEMAVGAGAAAGAATGALAGIAVAAGVGALYQKAVPLEWRERIDATFWHLPYHLGLANW